MLAKSIKTINQGGYMANTKNFENKTAEEKLKYVRSNASNINSDIPGHCTRYNRYNLEGREYDRL